MKTSIIAIMVLGLSLASMPAMAKKNNYKKDYCSSQDYVGNSSNKYPHLHCGRGFYTYSKGKDSSQHANMVSSGQAMCGIAGTVQTQIHDLDAKTVADKDAMVTSIDDFVSDFCQ